MHLHQTSMLMRRRTTLDLDEALVKRAQRACGLTGKTAVIHGGFEALAARRWTADPVSEEGKESNE